MVNWVNPVLSTAYTQVLTDLNDKDIDSATMFDGSVSTNLPTGAYRINSSSNYELERWTGLAWASASLSIGGSIREGGTLLSAKYLGIAATAANSTLFNSLNSSQFLRSDATDTGTNLTLQSLTVTSGDGFLWESGRSRITHNDGGGNCQIRFGNKFNVSEVYTADDSSAVRIRQDIDSVLQPLMITVGNNATVTDGDAVTWGTTLYLYPTSLNFAGTINATTFVGALTGNASTATTAGTVTTPAQSVITSVGTLTSLDVSGAITVTNGVNRLTRSGGYVSVSAAAAPSTGQVLMATGASAATWQTIQGVPVGSTLIWHTATAPTGFLELNGASLSTTTYAALFAVLGYTYGGSGANFSLPDMRGYFPRGWSHGSSTDPDRASRTNRGDGTTGDNIGTKQANQNALHGHPYRGRPASESSASVQTTGGFPFKTTGTSYPEFTGTVSDTAGQQIGGNGGNESRPVNINVMWIIKY